jgi:hypothetical protein
MLFSSKKALLLNFEGHKTAGWFIFTDTIKNICFDQYCESFWRESLQKEGVQPA